MLVVGGATELPTTPDYFTKNDPVVLANTVAGLVKQFGIDGVDLGSCNKTKCSGRDDEQDLGRDGVGNGHRQELIRGR